MSPTLFAQLLEEVQDGWTVEPPLPGFVGNRYSFEYRGHTARVYHVSQMEPTKPYYCFEVYYDGQSELMGGDYDLANARQKIVQWVNDRIRKGDEHGTDLPE